MLWAADIGGNPVTALSELVADLEREAAEIRQRELWQQTDWVMARAVTLESVAARIKTVCHLT